MSDRAAPRVFVSYANDSPEHTAQVRRFAEFLRTQVGLDAHLDIWYRDRRRDWSVWATDHLTKAEFVLVVASPQYKLQAEGEAAPDESGRAELEAAILRDNLAKNLRDGTERILPVVLPGRSVREIPAFLNPHSATSFRVDEFTVGGISDLLAAITGQGQYPLPELGQWPGDAGADERPVTTLLAGMRWLTSSPGLRPGSAKINGVRYDNSVVSRHRPSTGEPRVFVEVDLDRAYRRMTSVAGVLDDASEPFQVGHFVISVDAHVRWQRKAALGKPVAVDLDIAGARTLRLEMHRGAARSSAVPTATRLSELAWGNPCLS
ncbi:hypothetical protein ALI144C_48685 [Actinosynnema sp. ALI-1.44]|uniref:SEFIR domain-containing protein n=1 Tax=Actinosynnema sp. ALI-1.44 TaxID=1933779 RepID=UPI00097C081E|nr:SEFIR domain-containing protein [Actinosynnema sp. ALI-1.44]ONI70522.1 hypothetical protein ALI144C_48685 [Actinosynnema sp. ALI-1.44]